MIICRSIEELGHIITLCHAPTVMRVNGNPTHPVVRGPERHCSHDIRENSIDFGNVILCVQWTRGVDERIRVFRFLQHAKASRRPAVIL